MKQFFLLLMTLIVISHIYSTVLTNTVNSKSTVEVKSSSLSKSLLKTQAKSSTKVQSKTESNSEKPKKKKNKKKKKKVIRIKRKTFKNPIAIIKTGWLKVSTKMFTNGVKFPTLVLRNNKEIRLKVNGKNFRINEAYKKGSTDSNLPKGKKYFWFRLSGKHMYYSMTKNDINILGDVTLKNIITSYATQNGNNEQNCFKIVDREGRNFKLCAENYRARGEWVCKIKDLLGYTDKSCMDPNFAANPIVIERKIDQPIILIPMPSPKCNENWNYGKKGADWNCECSEGI